MDNLTSFTLAHMSQISVKHLLDFFESAPHLREVDLTFVTPTSGAQDERLVSLVSLKRMNIQSGPSSLLLDHLLIPVGACLNIEVDLPSNPTGGRSPKFFDNFRNLASFTTFQLYGGLGLRMEFSGPDGESV